MTTRIGETNLNIKAIVAAAAFTVAPSMANPTDVVVKKSMDVGPVYSVDVSKECTVGMEFFPSYRSIQWQTSCHNGTLDLTAIVDSVLNAATTDGIDLKGYKSFGLGFIDDVIWRQRLIDCYVARFGLDERRLFPQVDSHDFIDKCRVFRELDMSFAKRGLAIHVSSLEKGTAIDLAKDERSGGPEVRLPADAKRHRGLIFENAIVWFAITH